MNPQANDNISVPATAIAPRGLSEGERATLARVADTLIPASGGIPAASAEPGFWDALAIALDARADAFDDIADALRAFSETPADELWSRLQSLNRGRPATFQALSAVVAWAWLNTAGTRDRIGYHGQQSKKVGPEEAVDEIMSGVLEPVIARAAARTRAVEVAIDESALDDLLLRLIATPSLSTQEGDCAALVAEELQRLGMTVDVDVMGNVVGRLALGPGPTVMIDCHLDTVPIVDAAQWSRSPHGEIHDGRVYGRGAVDMKGPLAAAIHAVKAIRGTSRGTVIFAGTVAEELVEGPAAVQVAKAASPDFVIICEPSQRRIARGQRGRAEIVIDIRGRSSHSAYPAEGVNAAEVMVDVITELRTITPPRDAVLGDGILVLIDVKSEPYPSLSTVPERCRATLDRRTLVGESAADVLDPVRQVVTRVSARSGATGTAELAEHRHTTYSGHVVETAKFAPAWLSGPDAAVVSRAVAGLTAAGLPATVTHYRFCTNGSGTAGLLGIPTIGYGPGHEDQAHKVDEFIEVSDLHLGARGYAAILTALLSRDLDGGSR